MSWTDFYIQTTGSNLNAGSTNSDSAVYTSTSGNFDGTSVFTPTDGQTTTSLVNVGDWASIYPTGNSITPYVAQVTAVGAGVNGTITLSTTLKFGTAPTSNSGSRNCKTGGAWADLGLCASGGVLNTGTVTQSTRLNVKAGTYANTTNNRTLGLAGAATTPFWIRGYKTSPGDQDTNASAVAGTDIPSITFTSGHYGTAAHQTYSNLSFLVTTATTNAVAGSSADKFYRCRFENQNAAAASGAFGGSTGVLLEFCWLKATTTATQVMSTASGGMVIKACAIRGGAGGVTLSGGTSGTISDCVFDANQGDAILLSGVTSINIDNCSIYAPTGNGINISTVPSSGLVISNCHFENVNQAAKAAINNTSGTNTDLITPTGNSFYNNTANYSGISESFTIYDVGTVAGSGFNNPASHDFTPTTYIKGVGVPGAFDNETYTGYMSTGALQPQTTSSGGMLRHPGMSGGMVG